MTKGTYLTQITFPTFHPENQSVPDFLSIDIKHVYIKRYFISDHIWAWDVGPLDLDISQNLTKIPQKHEQYRISDQFLHNIPIHTS